MPNSIRYETFYIRSHVGKQCSDVVLMKLRDVTTTPPRPQRASPHASPEVQRIIGHAVAAVVCRGHVLSLVWRRSHPFIRMNLSPALALYIPIHTHGFWSVSKLSWKWSHIFSYHGGPLWATASMVHCRAAAAARYPYRTR